MLRQLNRFAVPFISTILLVITLPVKAATVSNAVSWKSKVTIEFIYDYQCPYCHAMTPDIEELAEEGFTVKWTPVAIIHNPLSLEEATGAIAATHCPDGFYGYQAITEMNPVMKADQIDSVAAYLNQQCPDFKKNQHASWVKKELDDNTTEFHQTGATGVPVTVIYPTDHPDKRIVLQGEQSSQTIKEAIDAAENEV